MTLPVSRFLALLLSLAAIAAGQAPQSESVKEMSAPPRLPYVDAGACPFEGCVYREWTARRQTPVFDSWKAERRQTATLAKGDKVTGVTGVVVTLKPGLIRVDRDLPEANLHRGDTVQTYTYRGEGFSAAWVKGRFYSDFDISFARWPDGSGCGGAHCGGTYVDLGKKEWWAQVRLSSGLTGWVNMDAAPFRGADGISER